MNFVHLLVIYIEPKPCVINRLREKLALSSKTQPKGRKNP